MNTGIFEITDRKQSTVNEHDIENFILAAFSDNTYTVTYKCKAISVTFSLISKKDADDIERKLEDEVFKKNIKSRVMEEATRDYLRILASVESLALNNVTVYNNKTHTTDRLEEILKTEAAYLIIRHLYKKFNRHCMDIISEVTSQNFFTNTSQVSDLSQL